MRQFAGVQDQTRALLVVRSVVRHPGLTEDLPSKPTGIFVFVLPIEPPKLRVCALDLKGVRGGAKSGYGTAALEVVDNLLHLVVGEVLKPQEHHEQVSGLQRVEARNI